MDYKIVENLIVSFGLLVWGGFSIFLFESDLNCLVWYVGGSWLVVRLVLKFVFEERCI